MRNEIISKDHRSFIFTEVIHQRVKQLTNFYQQYAEHTFNTSQ